jgi:hypothetical protein
MTYYNVITHDEHATLPTHYPDVLGSPDWALHYARGEREVQPFTVPDGYAVIPGTRRIEVNLDVPCEVWDIETVEQGQARAAEAEAARLAGLVAVHGPAVGLLQALLVKIGLSIPTTPEAVRERVTSLVAGGTTEAGLVGLLIQEQYDALGDAGHDVRAIWDAIKGATP